MNTPRPEHPDTWLPPYDPKTGASKLLACDVCGHTFGADRLPLYHCTCGADLCSPTCRRKHREECPEPPANARRRRSK